jgi:hypothetical protein
MCTHFAPRLPSGCDEQDALEVRDKANANFCDYFRPSAKAFDAGQSAAVARSTAELEALFGKCSGAAPAAANDDALAKAESLFKK